MLKEGQRYKAALPHTDPERRVTVLGTKSHTFTSQIFSEERLQCFTVALTLHALSNQGRIFIKWYLTIQNILRKKKTSNYEITFTINITINIYHRHYHKHLPRLRGPTSSVLIKNKPQQGTSSESLPQNSGPRIQKSSNRVSEPRVIGSMAVGWAVA